MKDEWILAVDLGGTKLAGALFNNEGELIYRDSKQIAGCGGEEVGIMISDLAEEFLKKAPGGRVSALGVAVPGIYFQKEGTVWAPNIPGWESYPLRSQLSDQLGSRAKNLVIDSDRACYVAGETWRGISQGCRDVVYLAVGTGIGAGILIDGQILRGSRDIAGAIGWMALKEKYQPLYKTYGCFEYHASGQGLSLQMPSLYPDARALFEASDRGDLQAQEFVENAILCWAQASANLVSLLNPEMIVFGGGVFGPAARWIQRIKEEAMRWGQPVSMSQVRFEASVLGDRAALYGAAFLAGKSTR